MRRSTGVLLAVLVALAFVVSVGPLAGPAAACSCVSQTEQERFDRATAVFVATLVSHQLSTDVDADVGVFDVTEVRKGEVAPRQVITTGTQGSACGSGPWKEGSYAFFAGNASTGTLSSGSCGGNDFLGVVTPSPTVAPPAKDETQGVNGPVLLLSFTTVAAVVGFLLIVRRHRRRMREAQRRQQPRARPSR